MVEQGAPKKGDGGQRKKAAGILPQDRPQPHDLDAERAILAAMMLEPSPCVDTAIEQLGSADVFYAPEHRLLFSCIDDLYNKKAMGVDLISIASVLEADGKLDVIGGRVFLAEVQNSIATTANIDTWCQIVSNLSILRNMINVCVEATEKCFDVGNDVEQLVDEIEASIYEVRYQNVKPDIMELREYIHETFANVQKILRKEVEPGIPTGYPDLDRLITGLKPGEMFVLAARPSIGKTSLALNIIRNIALKGGGGRPVAFFSLEMTADQIARRLLCTESGIPETAFFDGSFKKTDISKLTSAVSTFKKTKLFIDPTGGLTIPDLRAKARRLKSQHDIQAIIIDYLQLMKAGGKVESRQIEVAEISSGLKKLAKDLSVPVLVLAQLNRELEKSGSGKTRPKLSHLRESGAIEQDADIVVFLHRDRDESKVDAGRVGGVQEGVDSELIVEKNRNGQTGIVELTFHPSTMEFKSKSRYNSDDRPPPLEAEEKDNVVAQT